MPASKNTKRLYVVRLSGGRSNDDWKAFYLAVDSLNGKSPDYGGITSVAVVATHHTPGMLQSIVSSDMRDESALTIEEITSESLEDYEHAIFADLIRRYFLPYGDYPSVDDWFDDE